MVRKPGDHTLDQLEQENQRLHRQIAQLSEVSLRITSTLDSHTVLQEVVDAACRLIDARYGALAVFNDRQEVQEFYTHGLSLEEQSAIGSFPKGKGLLGWLQETRTPLRLRDISQHSQSSGFPANHPPMRSFLGAPIMYGDEVLGNIYLTEKQGIDGFSEEDETLLMMFVAQAAVAVRNAGLQERALSQAAERGELLARSEQERARLETLVATSPVGVFLAEAATRRVMLMNHEAERILGMEFERGASLDRYVETLEYLGPDGRPYTLGELPLHRALFHGEHVRAAQVWIRRPSGETVPTLIDAAPVYAVSGEITSAIAVLQDVTSLEEVERLRNEFLGMVSHELKTPLTAIKGAASTVLGSRRAFDPDESHELFEIINEQADRLRDMVDNLLDMSRIEVGSLSVNPRPTDLSSIIDEEVASFSRAHDGREVKVEIPEGLPQLNADRRRLAQIVANLLGNAAKFSPGSAPITVRVSYDTSYATVQVQDQGRGIPEEKIPHLFRKFSQIHDEGGAKLSGSGLGLAICKGIIEAHGGRIWAESLGSGQGAVFSFTVPLTTQSALPDLTQRTEHMGRVHRAGERTKILCVDDEPRILRYLQRSLEEVGYHPITTSDAAEVGGMVEMEEPDLVLLDLRLSGTSGFDILRRVREISGVPVIILTVSDSSEDTVKALRLGADDYITKPFSPSELLARIEASLRRRVLPDVLESQPPFALGGLVITFGERRVSVDGQAIALSATEYKLLYELATHAGRVLTHDQILQRVWGSDYSGETELVRSFVRNLRRKLGDDARHPRYIFTEPQVGYRMPRPDDS